MGKKRDTDEGIYWKRFSIAADDVNKPRNDYP